MVHSSVSNLTRTRTRPFVGSVYFKSWRPKTLSDYRPQNPTSIPWRFGDQQLSQSLMSSLVVFLRQKNFRFSNLTLCEDNHTMTLPRFSWDIILCKIGFIPFSAITSRSCNLGYKFEGHSLCLSYHSLVSIILSKWCALKGDLACESPRGSVAEGWRRIGWNPFWWY